MTDGIWRVTAPDLLDLAIGERRRLLRGFSGWLDQLTAPALLTVSGRTGQGAGRPTTAVHVRLSEASGRVPEHLIHELETRCGATLTGVGRPPALAEGPVQERPRSIRWGGSWIRTIRLTQFPGAQVDPGWLWELLPRGADFDLTLWVTPKPVAEVERELRRRLRGLRTRALAAEVSGSPAQARVEVRAAETRRLMELIARGEGRLFGVALNVSVAALSPPQLDDAIRRVQLRAAALRAVFTPCWWDELPALLETRGERLPAKGAARVLATADLATCWPWLAGSEGHTEVTLGRHARTGAPVGLDIESGGLPNSNISVIAASGAGKSFLAGLIGLQAARRGVRTVLLDPENEHRRWCLAAGGRYLDLAESRESGLNVLRAGAPGEAALAALELVRLLCGDLTPDETGALLEACRQELHRDGPPATLGNCLAVLASTAPGLAGRLRPWLEDRAGQLFNGEGAEPQVEAVLAFGLRDLPSSWRPGAAYLVSEWLWSWARRDPGSKLLIVDEAGLLSTSPSLRRLLTEMARRIRKYRGALIALTQAAVDLEDPEGGEVVAVNSATVLVGSQPAQGADRLAGKLALDGYHREWLRGAGRGEFLMVSGPRRVPLRVRADDSQRRWLSGE